MLISEFARAAKLPIDTIRYYVRLGLICPELSTKGGARPYQVFTDEHLTAARTVRTAQSLGMSLREIAALIEQRRAGELSREGRVAFLRAQLERLEHRATELAVTRAYLVKKIAWVEAGQLGAAPALGEPSPHPVLAERLGGL